MKILITGGSGFLGSHVADELTKRGHYVKIFDIKKAKWIRKNQKFIKGNILDFKKLSKVMHKVDYMFHFAALASLDEALFKPLETVKNNILGTVNILELAKKKKIKRVIYASSIYSTSIQGGFYKCSKRAAEDYIEEYKKRYNLNFTILRYGSLYGSRSGPDNGVNRIIKSARNGKNIIYIGKKNAVRRYIHVSDAAKASANMISDKYKNKYVNIVGNKSYRITELFKIISKLFGKQFNVKYNPKKYAGHYAKNPKIFKINQGLNYIFRNNINLEAGVKQLIKKK